MDALAMPASASVSTMASNRKPRPEQQPHVAAMSGAAAVYADRVEGPGVSAFWDGAALVLPQRTIHGGVSHGLVSVRLWRNE